MKAAVDTSAAKAAEQGLRATWGESGVLVTTKANVAGGLVLGESVLVSRGGMFWRFAAAQLPKEAKVAQACMHPWGWLDCVRSSRALPEMVGCPTPRPPARLHLMGGDAAAALLLLLLGVAG